MPLNDEHIVAYWIFRGIWRTITFTVILTINNATSKNLPSSVTNWLQIGVQYPTLWRTFNPWYYHARTTICIFWLWYFQESLIERTLWMFVLKYLCIKLSACQIKKMKRWLFCKLRNNSVYSLNGDREWLHRYRKKSTGHDCRRIRGGGQYNHHVQLSVTH